MNTKISKNTRTTFKVFAIVLALVFTVLFLPMTEFVALAKTAAEYVDYTYIQIGADEVTVETEVYNGQTYTIPYAYIGGSEDYVIGDDDLNSEPIGNSGATLVSSNITVKYGTVVIDEDIKAGESFTVERVGTYTITYSYTYTYNEKTYTNSYDLQFESYVSNATIELDNNSEFLFPSIIDASLLKFDEQDEYAGLRLPIPTVYDEDGDEVENINIIYSGEATVGEGDYLVISLTGPQVSENVLAKDDEGNVYIPASVLTAQTNYATYTIKYSYYHDGEFIVSTTKSSTVYENYYEGTYSASNLVLELDSSLTTSAQPGIEQTLPGVIVTTNNNVNHSNEEIEVYYKVMVKYRAAGNTSYALLDTDLYNTDPENPVIDEDGYLIDPTTFTPLLAGNYSFNYVAYDVYGNEIPSGGTADGTYEWLNIIDSTSPTAIIYDASEKDSEEKLTYADASSKLARYHAYNSVVIYAIGIEDNLSTAEDSTLSRVVYANSEVLFEIDDFDEYNLIFNYRGSSSSDTNAFQLLQENNYLIRKAVTKYNASLTNGSEDPNYIYDNYTMLAWLKANGYLIVIDNGGTNGTTKYTYARDIYSYFSETFNSEIEGVEDEETFITWLTDEDNYDTVKETLQSLGFAYLQNSYTFGASSSSYNGGYSYSSYQIRYNVTDAAGNTSYISRDLTLSSSVDNTPPTLSISTTFSGTYLNTSEVEFNVPTASDTDSRLTIYTYYRFVDADGNPVTIDGLDQTKDVVEVFDDLRSQTYYTDSTGAYLYQRYAEYDGEGYIDLTDSTAESYVIDLTPAANTTATKVQIFTFTYDDYGNVGVLGVEFEIAQTIDTYAPSLKSVIIDDVETDSYWQGDEITLPTVTVIDDNVDYMSYYINVYNIRSDGSTITLATPSNSDQSRYSLDYTYTVIGGSFNAAYSGEYVASIELRDFENRRIVVFTHYEAKARIIVQDPVVNISFENQTVELDDSPVIELPTPKVSYSVDNSIDYPTYKTYLTNDYYTTGDDPLELPSMVFIGVNASGEATDYSTSYGQAGYFTPTEKGVYTIQYTTRLRVYNPSVFAYNEGTVDDAYSGRVVNYFTELDDDYDDYGYKIKTIDETTYEVYANEQSSGSGYTYDVYTVTLDEDGNLVITDEDGADASGSVSDIDTDRYEYWQNNLIMYIYESDIFTVTVTDTTGPEIREYNYIESIAYEDLSKVDSEGNVVGYELKIFGIQATDASGIDYEDSSVVITTTYKYNGNTTSNTERLSGDDKIDGTTIYVTRNGTVTITYTVYDNNGNSSTATYTIRSGDSTDPIITADEDFLESSYTLTELQKNNYQFEVDTSKLTFTDDMSDAVDMIVTYVLENNDTGEEIELTDQDEYILIYTIDEVGSYTLTVTVTDEADNTTSETFDFEVTEEETEDGYLYWVIGTVLVVISVLLLAGVVIYFIISKVKLDKELKK